MKRSKNKNNIRGSFSSSKALYTKWWFWAICATAFLLIVHVLFSIPAPNSFLVAKWSAGELISFVGTIVLGCVAVMQTHRANVLAEKATNISERLMERELSEMLPLIDVRQLSQSALESCSIHKSLNASVFDCYCVLNDRFEITESEGDVLFFEIKNVCNHDILGVDLTEIKIECLQDRVYKYACCVDANGNVLAKEESSVLVITIPTKHFIKVADANSKATNQKEQITLNLTINFVLLNNDGMKYEEKISFDLVNAIQTGFAGPVILNKQIETPSIFQS